MQGLAAAVSMVRKSLGPDFPIIYDHQKGGNDIPDMGMQFAEVLKKSGVKISMETSGAVALIFFIHLTNCPAPPSSKSSLVTDVITTCFRPSFAIACASLAGS